MASKGQPPGASAGHLQALLLELQPAPRGCSAPVPPGPRGFLMRAHLPSLGESCIVRPGAAGSSLDRRDLSPARVGGPGLGCGWGVSSGDPSRCVVPRAVRLPAEQDRLWGWL